MLNVHSVRINLNHQRQRIFNVVNVARGLIHNGKGTTINRRCYEERMKIINGEKYFSGNFVRYLIAVISSLSVLLGVLVGMQL